MNTSIQTSMEGKGSFYEHIRSKQNTVVSLAEFVTAIRSERWKQPVETYRKLMSEGRSAEAKPIKDGMPGIVAAGVCEGGHSKQNFRHFSGYMMVDIDHFDGEIHPLVQQLERFPWTRAGWVSISGEGVKCLVRIDAATPEEYEGAYPLVARTLTRLLGVPVDMQCKDLSRVCYASHDPAAFWKDTCEVFPWREEKEADAPQDKPEDQGASGLVASFLERFLDRYPYVPNHRHQFLLALGRSARASGMNENELKQLLLLAGSRLSMPDCNEAEIHRTITDSYHFMHEKMGQKNEPFKVWGHKGHLAPVFDPSSEGGTDEETLEHNHKIRCSAPCLPDWIFDQLPDFLKRGIVVAQTPRQRDMLLLSMITNLSACLPNVKMLYDNTYIYPHLFLAVIASSASGKGIMTDASRLAQPIQKMFTEENESKQKEYDKASLLWDRERQQAMKEKRNPNIDLRPEPVKRRTLMVPADVSRTQLVKLLSTSPQGILLNVSEMDTLRTASNAEYGKFDDLMRACYHHEMFGTDFKSDGQQYMVYCPKMAFCASGTPNQFLRLCPSIEDGSYSRYLIYLGEQDVNFRSMAPTDARYNRNQLFRELGGEVLDMYRYLLARPTDVLLTSDQWSWHLAYFNDVLQGVKVEETEGPISVVLRYGLSAARLAMIFTALRKYESKWEFYDVKCTDEDFRLAMAIIEVLLHHSLLWSTSLRKSDVKQSLMKNYFIVREGLEKLKSKFTFTELVNALVSVGMSDSAARRARKRLLDMEIIVKEGDIYRFVHRKWRGLFEKMGFGAGAR